MARQWFMPGVDALHRGGMIDEDGTEEYFVPEVGYLNEDQSAVVITANLVAIYKRRRRG